MFDRFKDKLLGRQPIDKHAGEYYKHEIKKEENPELLNALDECLGESSVEETKDV